MAETSIQKAARISRENKAKREAEAAAAEAAEPVEEEAEEEGFFQSFFGRAAAVDDAVEAADPGPNPDNQSTDNSQ